LLGAILDADAGALADVLVVGAFVGILESPPAAHVVDQDGLEVSAARLHVIDELLQRIAAIESKTTFALVGICPNNLNSSLAGVLPNCVSLVLG